MATNTNYKRNDQLPDYTATLLQGDNTPINLTGATVKFLMTSIVGNTPKVNATATVVNAAQGQVAYVWGATDLDTEGEYEVEWEVTFGNGKKLTVPAADYDTITVRKDIA